MIAKKEKKEIFEKSLSKLKYELKNKSRDKQEDSLLNCIYSTERRAGNINYKESFMLLMNLSNQYKIALERIKENKFDQKILESELFWNDKMEVNSDDKISYYSFFIYRYLIELNPDIIYDFQQMQGLSVEQIKKFIKEM